jgi:2-keto-4-pentenoate hydratase/2-oxohepta-3-ene-1,7-dioic acid hydratase in catechol pathway
MRKIAAVTFLLLLVATVSSYWLSRPVFDARFTEAPLNSLSIAPIDEALTLARSVEGAVLLVTAADSDGVSVIDINAVLATRFASPVEAYSTLGYMRLREMFETAHKYQSMPWSELGIPVDPVYSNIAAGTNYRSHAEEVGHDGDPFLFPKLSRPSPWNAGVVDGSRLDYEVELCVLPLKDYTAGSTPVLGYILCNDFTDRWLLVRDIDLDGPMGVSGFTVGKGGETRLPVGPLLLVPRRNNFYKHIELALYVGDVLRQKTRADAMIWSPEEILEQALAQCRVSYDLEGSSITLGSCDAIAAGTLVLTGTPEGVMFHAATIWSPWAYLRPGQKVSAYGTYLGRLENLITPAR